MMGAFSRRYQNVQRRFSQMYDSRFPTFTVILLFEWRNPESDLDLEVGVPQVPRGRKVWQRRIQRSFTLNLNQWESLRFSENSLNFSLYSHWKNSVVRHWLKFSEVSLILGLTDSNLECCYCNLGIYFRIELVNFHWFSDSCWFKFIVIAIATWVLSDYLLNSNLF